MFEALPGMADFGGGSEGGGGGSRRTSKVQNRKGWDDDSEEDEAELDAYVHLAIGHGTCCTARCPLPLRLLLRLVLLTAPPLTAVVPGEGEPGAQRSRGAGGSVL